MNKALQALKLILQDEKIALEAVIGQLLDEQDITSACRVSTLFRQVTDDLELVVVSAIISFVTWNRIFDCGVLVCLAVMPMSCSWPNKVYWTEL